MIEADKYMGISGGKDSAALAIYNKRNPHLDIDYFYGWVRNYGL